MLFQQNNAFPTFTEETVKAINEATKGKLDALWEAENLIIAAILADKSLDPMVKAQEVQRSMARYVATANQYSSVTTVMSGMGMYPYTTYGAYQPSQQISPSGIMTYYHKFSDDDNVNHTVTYQFINNKLQSIYIGNDSVFSLVTVDVYGVINNEEDNDTVAIAIRCDRGVFDNELIVKELYGSLIKLLGIFDDDHLYSYTVRKSGESDILYIDLIDDCDYTDIENFSDIIKGRFHQFVTYDQLFPESTD